MIAEFMDPAILGFILVGVMLFAIFVGFPISFTLIFLGFVFGYLGFGKLVFYLMTLQFSMVMTEQTLAAVPLFVFMGIMMEQAGLMERLFSAFQLMLAKVKGSLYYAVLFVSVIFAAATGIVGASVTILGIMAAKSMNRSGYDVRLAAGTITAGGTLGILIPPSLVMVIYGAVTESSIGNLFIAGLLPGLFLTIVMIVTVAIIARKQNLPRQKKVSFKETIRRGLDAFWGLLLLFIILGGIYSGIFTPTEAAAVSAVYAFVIAVFIYKDIKLSQVPKVLTDSAKVTAMLMFIIANAYVFANVLTTEQIPQATSEWIISLGLPAWGFLIVLNILLLAAGNFMEPTSVVLILTPIVYPIAMELGIDPIHLGIIMVLNMQMGLVTPPVGLNLFVTAGVANMSMEKVIQASLPWLIVLLGVLIVITYVPVISLIVPQLLGII